MNCCEACFQPHANPLDTLAQAAHLGTCSLCGKANTDVWDATELLDAFTTVVSHYELTDDENAKSISAQMQDDWAIFTAEAEPQMQPFLNAVFSGANAMIAGDQKARLRRDQDDGDDDEHDHASAWDRFAQDLKYGNRYFPTAVYNPGFFQRIVGLRTRIIDPDFELFRARVCDDEHGYPVEEMSMPPREFARAGRANPQGIPHLYLAKSEETCIRESRAVQHNFVTVATFRVKEDLQVLDLDGFKLLNPFEIEEDAAAQLDVARTLERLGRELEKPVRPTDDEVEYVPTQYLSGLVRSLGLDGILYSSSLDPDGTNIVLFDQEKVEVKPDPVVYVITSMTLEKTEAGGTA